jgi:hypothetical protein
MSDGWYVSEETGDKVPQAMHRAATEEELLENVDNVKGINEDGTIFKGIYAILREGGHNCKDDNGVALVKECSKARRLLAGCALGESCKKNARCCLQNCLRWRPDFCTQKCRLEQVCNAAGCNFIMLPKCHPELNPIENYWSFTKRYSRQWCDYTVAGLRRVLPAAFLSAKMDWVRKAFERCDRYLDIYALEKSAMPFGLREYMVKKYKSHRRVFTTIEALLDTTFDDLLAKKVDLERRQETTGIKHEKSQKVQGLLKQLERGLESIPAVDMNQSLRQLQIKMDNVALTEENKAVEMINLSKFHRNLVKKGQLGRQGSWLYHTWMRENQTLSHPVGLPTVLIARRNRIQARSTSEAGQSVRAAKCPEQIESGHDMNESEQRQRHERNGIEKCDNAEDHINWVQCEQCSKWRKLPIGFDANSLPNEWNCDMSGEFLGLGLNCHVPEDTTYAGDAIPESNEVDDCHQPPTGGYRVTRVSVLLNPFEETTIRSVWGLRPCYTWGDGYCGFRCAAANRGSTMQQMLHALYSFWEWKWAKNFNEGQLTYSKAGPYKYTYPGLPDWNYDREYNEEVAQSKIAELRPVEQALANGREKLHSRHWCAEDIFEALATIDNMCILFIKTRPEPGEPAYKVFRPKVCVVVSMLEDITGVLMQAKAEGLTVRGVALQNAHFCSLYPRNMQPNFAGRTAIGSFK